MMAEHVEESRKARPKTFEVWEHFQVITSYLQYMTLHLRVTL